MGRRPLILASSVRHRPRAPPTDACAAGCLRGATPRGRVCAHASVCVQPPGGACSLAHPVSLRAPNPSAQRRAPTPRATPQRHAPTRGATACHAAAPPPPALPRPARSRRKVPLPSGGGVLARRAAGPGRARHVPPGAAAARRARRRHRAALPGAQPGRGQRRRGAARLHGAAGHLQPGGEGALARALALAGRSAAGCGPGGRPG